MEYEIIIPDSLVEQLLIEAAEREVSVEEIVTEAIDEDSLTQLQGLCVSEVKRLNGKVSFEDARRFQKG